MRLHLAAEEKQPEQQYEAERHTGHPQERGDQHAPFLSFVRSLDRTHIYNLLGEYQCNPHAANSAGVEETPDRDQEDLCKSQNLPASVLRFIRGVRASIGFDRAPETTTGW